MYIGFVQNVQCCNIDYYKLKINFENSLHMQHEDIEMKIRNIETTVNKLADGKITVIFNNICLNCNLLPKFSNTRLYMYY